MAEFDKYRILHRGEYHYFTLKDLTLQTPVYLNLLAGKKSFKTLDIYTGFHDVNGREIYTRDQLRCSYLTDDDQESPDITEYTVKFGDCYEYMYGSHFKGFYLKENETDYCFSLLDEFRNKKHTAFEIIQDPEKIRDFKSQEKKISLKIMLEEFKKGKEIRKIKIKRFLNLIKALYFDFRVILFRQKQELKKRQKQKLIQKMIKRSK